MTAVFIPQQAYTHPATKLQCVIFPSLASVVVTQVLNESVFPKKKEKNKKRNLINWVKCKM